MSEGDKTFKLDNVIVEFLPEWFGKRNPQLHLPGMEPFGPFDLWAALGCYSLLDPKKPTDPVTVTLTKFIEILEFSRTISEALGGYPTFASDAYTMVRESLHRLFTVEVSGTGYWNVKTGRRKRPERRPVEYHSRVLTSYVYIYPPDVIPPDQLPESKRRNVNRARTPKGESGPPVYQYASGPRPEAIQFRVSEEFLRGITKTDPNIGATILPVRIFELRNKIPNRDATTIRLLIWISRQAARSPRIGLDKLVRKMGLSQKSGFRNRDTVFRSLNLLVSFGVVKEFHHDPKKDQLVIVKADEWHYPARDDDEVAVIEGE